MQKKKVLIFSIEADVHADRVMSLLPSNVDAVRLNLDDPSTWSLAYCNGDVRVKIPSCTFGLDDILSVFLRRIPNFKSFKKTVAPQYVEQEDFITHQQFFLFSDCLAVLDASKPFVNPLATASRAGKAVQAHAALAIGLSTPATYMGADPNLATSFARRIFNQGKKVSTKPITNMKVRIDGQDHTRFTELLEPTMLDSIHSLSHCPLIFQEYIPKAYELRVTVIGNEIFAACIESQSAGGDTTVDWRRYNIPKTPHYAYELSPELRNQILALHQRLGLVYSSFDFIRTPQGEFVFLETNPFGQWLWIEDLTGLPISKAIADFLSTPSL